MVPILIRKRLSSALLAALLLLSGCGAETDEAAASFSPPEEQRLTVYTSHKEEVWKPIVQEFESRTGIWVDVVSGGSNELLERISSESEHPRADIMFGGGVDSLEVYRDCFSPYVAMEEEQILEQYRSADGLWTPFSSLPVVLIYNTKLLSPGRITGWSDLLQPEFRGKIAFADPGVSGSCFTGLVTLVSALDLETDDALRQFSAALDGRLLEGSGEILSAVADGSSWIGITLEETALKRTDAGDSIALVYPEDGTSLVPDGSALVKDAPHPDNAKKFLDFTVSADVQQLLTDQYRRPVREDTAANPALPELSSLTILDYDPEWASENHDALLMTWAFYLGGEETT